MKQLYSRGGIYILVEKNVAFIFQLYICEAIVLSQDRFITVFILEIKDKVVLSLALYCSKKFDNGKW